MTILQDDRPLRILTRLPANAVLIEKLSGTEAISELFHFDLDLLIQPELLTDCIAGTDQKYLAFEKLLGQPATVVVEPPGSPPRCFNGIIVELGEGLPVVGMGAQVLWRAHAVLAPKLWLLGRGLRSRVFQQKSVKFILEKILKTEYQLDCTLSLSATYDTRPCCIQYQESDLAFVSRLLQEEGIRYYFTHELDAAKSSYQHTLVLSDVVTGYPSLPSNRLTTTGWYKRQSVQSGRYQVRDHSLQRTRQALSTTRTLTDQFAAGPVGQKLKLPIQDVWRYEPEGNFAPRRDSINRQGQVDAATLGKLDDDSSHAADLEMQRTACRALVIQGTSHAAHGLPGFVFQLDGAHPQATGRYLFTEVEHRADLTGIYTDHQDAVLVYENHFRALPETMPYRPQLDTEPPTLHQPLTATVVADGSGKAGDLVNDSYGRVKVQFHWDAAEDENTCWLWVTQAWAGNGIGTYFMPRVGDDVLVSFVRGYRDQPIITGSVHSNENLPPFWDAKNKSVRNTVQGIRTRSVQGGTNDYSMISIDDQSQQELLSIRANRDSKVYTGNDALREVVNDGADYTGNDYSSSVAHDATYNVGHSRVEIVGYDGWFKTFPDIIPANKHLTYGARTKISCPLETNINFGSHGYVLLDPMDYLVNKAIPGENVWTRRFLTAVGGKTDFLYGNETRIMYGSLAKNFCRGQMLNSVLAFRGTEMGLKILSAAHLAALGLTIFLPLVRAKVGPNKGLDLTIAIVDKLQIVVQVLLKLAEKYYRAASIAKELTETETYLATLATDVPSGAAGITGISTLIAAHAGKLQTGQSGILHQEVEATYCLQAGQVLLISEGHVAITARDHHVTIMGDAVAIDTPQCDVFANTFKVKNALNSITMDATSIVLAAEDGVNKVEVTKDHILLTCGASSLEITAAKIQQLSQLLDNQAVAQNHDE